MTHALLLQTLQPLRLVHLQPAVLPLPVIVGLFGDTQAPTDLGYGLSFTQHYFHFPQLGKNLFDGVTETWQMALRSARPS